MHRTAGAAGGDSRSVPKRGGGGQVMERKQQAVDFQALTEECLRGLEAVDVAADQLHKLRDAIKDSSLPRPLSMHIMVISGRLLRASSSLHPPLYELSRLVALYAKPWEEKGSVLAKLHQSYAEHHRQLQLALSQLQTTGADLERMKEERLHMLWERLFAKSMTNQRHGRRWKFLIESFRQAAEKGEHIHFDDGDDDDDEDDDDLDSIGDDLPGDTNGRRRRRPPLKPTSRRETRPNILVAAERRQAERERMQQEILQLKSEVRSLMQTRDDLQTRLDKALLKKPVASAACQVQLLKPPGTEAPNEVLSAVSKAIAVNKSRSAGNDLPASNGGGDADNEEQVDIGEDSAVTHVHLIHISGFADVLLPDISIEAVVRPSITSDAKDTQRIRVADALYTGDSLFVGGELELQGLFVQDVVEVRVFTGFEEAELVATGTTTARALLESIHATTSCTLKCDDGSMTTRTTFVSATISMSLRTTAAMAAFAEEAGAGRCPSFLRLTIAASHTPLSDAQIEMMTPKFEGEKRRPLRRNRVKNNLDQDDDGHRQSAEAMRQEVDIANGLFELLDVNSEDLREATFTMQEMLELTLLHTRQLQALQHQYDARIEELVAEKLALEEAKSKEHKADNTQTSGMQTDPMPEPEPVVIEKEVEKLVEVEKIVEKIVERVKVVEKYVEVPVDTGGSAGFQRRYRPPRPRFNSPFLQRLVEYARESVKRRQELSDKVQGERDREIKAQMASRFILDERGRAEHDDAVPQIGQDVCLPAMFMPGGEGFSSKHAGAWYPMNTLGRRSQPPSMVSLPPVRLPPLSTSTSRQTVAGQRSTSPLNATMHPSAHAPPPTHQQQEQHQQQHDVPPPSSSSSSSSSHPVGASASVSFGSPLHMPPESQQTRPRTPTAVSWHRMRLANTRASSGTNRSTPPGTPTRRDSDLPWPGRAP